MKKKSTAFDKFKKKPSNAAIKEKFRQEKRKVKKEREAFFEEKKRVKREGLRDNNRATGNDPRSGNYRGRPGSNDNKPGGIRGGKGNEIEAGGQKTFPNEMTGIMPLNKFIAHAGICGRREAAEMVKKGLVKVNGTLVSEPGHKVSAKDDIKVNGKKIWLAKNLVYILLNKPKDYITTTDDPQNRKTVLDIVGRATEERVYPVGRLDRNTSGVLLLTNDGELAQKLTHPSNEIKKVYAVTLNKPLEKKDFDHILKGVTLEDGPASVDVLAYADIKDKTQLGVEIHSGRNRIVRRIFEALGYDVKNLDRVVFAGLTKKNIERGKFRFLTEKEVRDLKHFRKGK
jgi:23S rRNA pseudouridine2605 synthase